MKKKIAGLIAFIMVIIACGKDKLESKPSIRLKSISGKFVPVNGNMQIELEYTDKEGDIATDTLVCLKVRNNEIPAVTTLRDTLTLLLPDFPKRDKGIIQLDLTYQGHLISAENPAGPGGPQNDSLTMKFVLKDLAGNESDTLVIDDIVIER